jgi:hypothetical protein
MRLKKLLNCNHNGGLTEIHLELADGYREYELYYKSDLPKPYLSFKVSSWWFAGNRLNVVIYKPDGYVEKPIDKSKEIWYLT